MDNPDPYSQALSLAGSSGADAGLAYLLFVPLLLLFSGILAGYEAAFYGLSADDSDQLRQSDDSISRMLLRMLRRPHRIISTVLIGTNLCNIGMVVLLHQFVAHALVPWVPHPWWRALAEVLMIGMLLLVVVELGPKVWAVQSRMRYLRRFAPLVFVLSMLLIPLAWVLASFERLAQLWPQRQSRPSTQRSLMQAIDMADETDSPKEEKAILKALLNLANIPAKAIMRSRADMLTLPYEARPEDVARLITNYAHSRIPVVKGSLDQIEGILYSKDFFRWQGKPADQTWQSLIRPAFYVPETAPLNMLFDSLKKKRLHIAIVADEYGGTAGLITMEDILEEIFGELSEGYNRHNPVYQRITDKEFIFEAKTPLLDVYRILGLGEDWVEGESDTLGGLVLEQLGRFPSVGEVLVYPPFTFEILSATSRKIKLIRLNLEDEPTQFVDSES